MKCATNTAIARWRQWLRSGCFLAVTSSAGAWGLSDEDYDYLRRTQSLERYDAPVLNLGPKERSHLHNLINDPQSDAAVRDKNVKDTLGLFLRASAVGKGASRGIVGRTKEVKFQKCR